MLSRARVLIILAGVAIASAVGFSLAPVVAQSTLPTLLDSCATVTFDPNVKNAAGEVIGGNVTPGLDCVLKQFLRVAKFILAITGSVAMVIFVYTGFMYILYSSQADKAKKYTEGLQGAFLGIIIIFCSGIAVQYFDRAIRGKDDSGCAAMGNGYACANWGSNGVQCLPNLCLSDASASYKCCKPNTPENLNFTCAGTRGAIYSCMSPDSAQATDCDSNAALCPDGPGNARCCTTEDKFAQEFGAQTDVSADCSAEGPGYSCMDQLQGRNCVSGRCSFPGFSCCTPANKCECVCVDGVRQGLTDNESQCNDSCGGSGLGFCR